MTLQEYFKDWSKVIDFNILSSIMKKLDSEYLKSPIYPERHKVFKAFRICPLSSLKVVMLFQDPYPQKGAATGIAIGNEANVKYLSPSLNILKEAALNYEIPKDCCIFDPTLEMWARQGILMLNTALTVEANKPGSHTMIWRPFIIALLKHLSEYETGIIYVLFGKQAQTFKPYINSKLNDILEINHPAYYARVNERMPSELFTTISNKCKEKYGIPIKWYTGITD